MVARHHEIVELIGRFRLLDQQCTNDLKRLAAIQESGQFFILREPMPCPLCGAPPGGQRRDAACDGNVAAVTQAASAEIAKIKLLQSELHETVKSLSTEDVEVLREAAGLRADLKDYQQQIDSARSPDFSEARQQHTKLSPTHLARRGATIENVSRLLGHTSIKITERPYSPWVKSRQDALDAALDGANGWLSEIENQNDGKVVQLRSKR
jgi:hypothetical protein